jgi:hypothetical protein
MRIVIIIGAALGAALASSAHAQSVSSVSSDGIKRMLVYGTDPCPPSRQGDIVICARRPDHDRYRIPERFRPPDKLTGENEAWAYKAEQLEMVGATGTQSCSPVGPGGSTGCIQQLITQARKERQQEKRDEPKIP